MVLGSSQEVTVPEGKVWKVESGYSGSISNNYIDVRIDNTEFGSGANANSQFGIPGIWNSPLWLKAGDRIQGESAGASFSIIEFNLVSTSSSSGGSATDSSISSSSNLSYDDIFFRDESFTINSSTSGRYLAASPIVVPEGQVWKITHANRLRFIGNSLNDATGAVFFNNMNWNLTNSNEVFLPAGTHTVNFQSTYDGDVNNIVIQAIKYNSN